MSVWETEVWMRKKIRTICWIPLAPGQLPLSKEKKDHAKESKRLFLFLFPSLMDSSSRNIRENRRRGTHDPCKLHPLSFPSPKTELGVGRANKKGKRNWTKKARVEIAAPFFAIFCGKRIWVNAPLCIHLPFANFANVAGEGGGGLFYCIAWYKSSVGGREKITQPRLGGKFSFGMAWQLKRGFE